MPELSRRALSPRSTEAWSSPEDDFEAVALGVQAHGMETSRSLIWSPRVPVACVVVQFITCCFSLELILISIIIFIMTICAQSLAETQADFTSEGRLSLRSQAALGGHPLDSHVAVSASFCSCLE